MKKILLFLLILAVGGGAYGVYMYNKPHKNMQRQGADFELSAADLYSEFENDESAANTKYLDKVLQVTGNIREIIKEDEKVSVILETGNLMGGITCELDGFSEHDFSAFNEGDQLSLKGICTGMLLDVVLVRCVIIS